MSEFQPVLLTLPDAQIQPSLALEVLPYGLTIHKFLVQVDGRTHDIVIGPESRSEHVTQKYTNTIVGRYANRIPVGTHQLERNGIKSQLTTLASESPEVSLHGGPVGFDSLPWSVIKPEAPATLFSATELAQISALDESSYAIFRLRSPAGDQGYPGTLLTEVFVGLIAPSKEHLRERSDGPDEVDSSLGSVILVYRAKLEEPNTVTPVNLTQHWGFNLEASLREGISVKDHTLSIKSDRIAKLAPNSLGTGNYTLISEAQAHAHDSKLIGDRIPESGYDDYYLFEESARSSIPTRIPLSSFNETSDLVKDLLRESDDKERGARAEPTVQLASKKSGIKLYFDSNQNGAMFYSNAMANAAKGARKKIHGGSGIKDNGDAYGPGTAAFLEFHHPLAAFLYPENKDGEDTLLTSNELYHNYVRCDVKFGGGKRTD
ncbi:galactose mutarotase-like protein [Pholiota conissans]|uniref:Galactose mutarotase-like protein n=1 Tax=Pholiota conissans TaxID=109636 RepID=A0A9P6CX28_9AGAR|nr:galactose mutarotase-like protein [Pholiota conissans]